MSHCARHEIQGVFNSISLCIKPCQQAVGVYYITCRIQTDITGGANAWLGFLFVLQ